MKRILHLGAAPFQIPAIEYARRAGYSVFTCDNVLGNPGHRLAHQAFCVSTVDEPAVLELARSLDIDAILSFGSDVAALTVAKVAHALGLPGANVEAVEILTRKSLFRAFLDRHGLQRQRFAAFHRGEAGAAAKFAAGLGCTAVVKPVDSSGSRGVSVVRSGADLDAALEDAFAASRSGEILIEEHVQKAGTQVCGDGYMQDSRLVFIELGDGHYHEAEGGLAPYAESFPSTHDRSRLERLERKVEQVLAAAGYERGPFNLDAIFTPEGEPFIIEIGPRNGGNFIPSLIRHRTGVDMIAAAAEASLDAGYSLDTANKRSDGWFAGYMLHSLRAGTLSGIHVDARFRSHIVEENPYRRPGDHVVPFRTARDVIGNVLMAFDSQADMLEAIANFDAYCRPEIE
jgi:biotin carboxylase